MLLTHIRVTACVVAMLLPLAVGQSIAAPPFTVTPGQQAAPADPFNLTAAQQEKLKAIQKTVTQQISAVEEDDSLSRNAKVSKITALVQSSQAQQRQVLDANQQKLFDERKKQQDAVDPLHLTIPQRVLLSLIKRDTEKQMAEVAGKSGASVDARASQIEKIAAAQKQQQKSVLNRAQWSKLSALQSNQDGRDPLHLTMHQKIEQQVLQHDYAQQLSAIYDNKSMTKVQQQAKATSLIAEFKKSADAFLTPSQRVQEAKLMAQHQGAAH